METPFRSIVRQKILDAQAAPVPVLTARDVWLPAVKGKALAVIGMRRAGKTSFLWQLLAQRVAQGVPPVVPLPAGIELHPAAQWLLEPA